MTATEATTTRTTISVVRRARRLTDRHMAMALFAWSHGLGRELSLAPTGECSDSSPPAHFVAAHFRQASKAMNSLTSSAGKERVSLIHPSHPSLHTSICTSAIHLQHHPDHSPSMTGTTTIDQHCHPPSRHLQHNNNRHLPSVLLQQQRYGMRGRGRALLPSK
jgi:hypothetical protein